MTNNKQVCRNVCKFIMNTSLGKDWLRHVKLSSAALCLLKQPKREFRTILWIAWSVLAKNINPIKYLWTDLKMEVHKCSSFNLTEPERVCHDEWKKLPTSDEACRDLTKTPQSCNNCSKCLYKAGYWMQCGCVKTLRDI